MCNLSLPLSLPLASLMHNLRWICFATSFIFSSFFVYLYLPKQQQQHQRLVFNFAWKSANCSVCAWRNFLVVSLLCLFCKIDLVFGAENVVGRRSFSHLCSRDEWEREISYCCSFRSSSRRLLTALSGHGGCFSRNQFVFDKLKHKPTELHYHHSTFPSTPNACLWCLRTNYFH